MVGAVGVHPHIVVGSLECELRGGFGRAPLVLVRTGGAVLLINETTRCCGHRTRPRGWSLCLNRTRAQTRQSHKGQCKQMLHR